MGLVVLAKQSFVKEAGGALFCSGQVSLKGTESAPQGQNIFFRLITLREEVGGGGGKKHQRFCMSLKLLFHVWFPNIKITLKFHVALL